MTRLLGSDPAGIREAAGILRNGGIVAIPTETVYGLAADARNDAAIARIYEAKGRPATNPLIVHVADEAAARRCASDWPEAASVLARAFWPGPLTIIVPAAAGLSTRALGGGTTVGLRVPAHRAALELLRAADLPIAAPSANRSGRLSPVTAEHVRRDLDGRIDAILDGGPCEVGIESTVVNLSEEPARILRPGGVDAEALRKALGCVHAESVNVEGANRAPLLSPGLYRSHYAPTIPLRLATRDEAAAAGAGTGRVFIGSVPEGCEGVALPRDPVAAQARLYALLWELQDSGCDEIVVESPPDDGAWFAIADRLRRAAIQDDKRNG